MHSFRCTIAALAILAACAVNVFAGGSGLNVVVVVNTNSPNSIQLGNYYCEKRSVPPENVLRINWTGGNIVWTRAQLDSVLRTPLNNMLTARGLSNQVEYLVLSMDIPYRVTNTTVNVNNNFNSTTSALFYGFKDNAFDTAVFCTLAGGSTNGYSGSEGIYRKTPPISATSNSWLAMMITSTNLDSAKAIVDRGMASDSAFPSSIVYLARSYDVIRNIRHLLFDDAIFDTRLRGNYAMRNTNTYSDFGLGPMLGFQDGVQHFNMYGSYVPGAMADNLTSYSGQLFENSGHTTSMDFLNQGATASFGTVFEPCAYLEKFPSGRNYFYQSRGFSIAESYYQSVTNPYQGIMVGEPLAAPFAVPSDGGWSNLPVNSLLSGTTNLSLGFNSPDLSRPVQQVDLFVDGTLSQTITNFAPRTNNILYVTLNGFSTNYVLSGSNSLKSVASNLVLRLNTTAFSNNTRVAAFPRGDRIELQNLNIAKTGANIPLVVSNYIGTASVLGTFINSSGPTFLDTTALGIRNFAVTNAVASGTWLQIAVTKTNGAVTILSVTNPAGNTDTSVLVHMLMDSVNTNASLSAPDGVMADDLINYLVFYGFQGGEFNLRVRSLGWAESQIQAVITDSGPLTIIPSGTQRLDENLLHLRQRAHVYVTAGLTSFPLTFGFNTTTQSDGFHELTAVAYEGSHVRTQKRVSQTVRIANANFTAALNVLNGGTNTALETTLQFSVVANTNMMNRIELHTTGGLWATVSNAQTGNFSIAATNLHIGLHSFWALAVRNDGRQYRTDTKWLRIIGDEFPFSLSATGFAPVIKWPATAGRHYEVLSTTNITNAFVLRSSLTPTNSNGQWTETNNATSQRYYRVRSTP